MKSRHSDNCRSTGGAADGLIHLRRFCTLNLKPFAPNKMNPGSLNAADVSCSEKEKYIRITTSGKLKAWVLFFSFYRGTTSARRVGINSKS